MTFYVEVYKQPWQIKRAKPIRRLIVAADSSGKTARAMGEEVPVVQMSYMQIQAAIRTLWLLLPPSERPVPTNPPE